ncbi:hypothetical protein ACHAXH_007597 [Discostella pseudostelligera]
MRHHDDPNLPRQLLAVDGKQESDESASSLRLKPTKQAAPSLAQTPPPPQSGTSPSPLQNGVVLVRPTSMMEKVMVKKDVVNESKESFMNGGVHRGHRNQTHHEMVMNGNGMYRGHQKQSHTTSNGDTMTGYADQKELNSTFDHSLSNLVSMGTNRKLIKIRLDPGEKFAKPLMVTVAMDVLTKHGLGDVHDLSLGVGQKVQLQHKENDQGERSLEISFQPAPKSDAATHWKPPLVLSEENNERTDVATNDQQVQPHSEPQDQRADIRHSSNGAALKDDTVSEERPTPTAPSRFSINATTETSEVIVPKSAKPESMSPKSAKPEPLPSPSVKSLDPFVIPSILTSTVEKLVPTAKVGLAFRKANDVVVIEKIAPGSPAHGTALCAGFECLSINGHRLRSARRAAELVRESEKSLTLVVSNAPRPPGTLYTMISLKNPTDSGKDFALGMHFKMKHGLVKLVKIDAESPVLTTSMKVGDFIISIDGSAIESVHKAIEVLSKFKDGSVVPILYFSLRQLRVSLVEKVIGDLWKKEWSNGYKECIVLQPGHNSLIPWTLKFKEDGMCTLIDPLRGFRRSPMGSTTSSVPPALHSVVETINHGVVSVLSAICEGVELAVSKAIRGVGLESQNDMVVAL